MSLTNVVNNIYNDSCSKKKKKVFLPFCWTILIQHQHFLSITSITDSTSTINMSIRTNRSLLSLKQLFYFSKIYLAYMPSSNSKACNTLVFHHTIAEMLQGTEPEHQYSRVYRHCRFLFCI